MKKKLKLYYSGGKKNNYNFGDTLSPLVVSYLSSRKVIYSDLNNCDCVSIGSIIDKVIKKKWKRFLHFNFKPITILGTGSVGPDTYLRHDNLNILSMNNKSDQQVIDFNITGVVTDEFIIKINIGFPIKMMEVIRVSQTVSGDIQGDANNLLNNSKFKF